MTNEPEGMTLNRREVLASLGTAAAGYALGSVAPAMAQGTQPAANLQDMAYDQSRNAYVLPPLPYDYDALEPSIDRQTMRLHHDKHHAGYVRGLNKALAGLASARQSGDFSMVKHLSRQAAFNGSGHLLHSIFWQVMAPPGNGGGGEPTGRLARALGQSFGSVNAFRKHFAAAAGSVEGSGWGILAWEPASRGLVVLQAEKHQNLTMWGVKPLLVLDVWEHAYYLKYQNRRGEYVDNFWNVVNWNEVARRLPAA